MHFDELTKNEKLIVLTLRQMKPHEKIEIVADQKGREDYYVITKTLREILD